MKSISVLIAAICTLLSEIIFKLDVFQAQFTGIVPILARGVSETLRPIHSAFWKAIHDKDFGMEVPKGPAETIFILTKQNKKLVAIRYFRELSANTRKELFEEFYMLGTTEYATCGIEKDGVRNGLALAKKTVEVIERDFEKI